MASSLALIALFSLALFSGIIEARKDPGEYWQGVAAGRNEALVVEAIEHLAHVDLSVPNTKKITSDCHASKKDFVAATSNKKSFVTDFEPSATAHRDNDTQQKEDKSFMKDFEPRPNISVYDNDTRLKGEKTFDNDFEPRPNISVYDNDTGLKVEKEFDNYFEPRPNISVYED